MFNAYEKAHQAYDWLSMSDVRVVECVDVYEVYSALEAYSPGATNSTWSNSNMDKKVSLFILELFKLVEEEKMNYV